MEEEFIRNQERLKPQEEKIEEERSKVSKYLDYLNFDLISFCLSIFILLILFLR